jgi:ABC-2 type transport system ATP-binding protein
VNDPDLLVLDEPTTGIDPAGRRSLWRLVEGLADGGTTVFLTTHYMEEAERLADTVGLLADGRFVARGSPAELVADHGGDSRLVVATDAEPRVTNDLGYPAELADGQLTVYDVPPEAIGDVITRLEAAGATYDSLTWTEPDLEDVYLDLTGRAVTASGDAVDRGEMPLADGGQPTDDGQAGAGEGAAWTADRPEERR